MFNQWNWSSDEEVVLERSLDNMNVKKNEIPARTDLEFDIFGDLRVFNLVKCLLEN